MSCCNNSSSNQEGMLIVNKAREAAACAEANCASSFTNATNAATSATNAANSATAAAASAAAAATSETNTENLWEQFNALYLGSFAVAPTTDNEGNPLQEGALYWNSVSNTMFAWNGSAWATATNFNEFTNFTATGTTTARNLVTRFSDVVNVKDFGAGNGIDDTAAINAAIAAGSVVYFPRGLYKVTSPIIIEKTVRLIGDGSQSSFISIEHSGNGIVFQPVGAGTSNVFLNSCSLVDINILRPTSITTPADNIWLRQCNDFKAINVSSNNGNTCFRISGGQLNSLDGCRAFASNTSIVKATQNAGILLEDAELSGGSFQPCYTVNIQNLFGSTTNVLDYNIKVRSADGLNINNAYLAYANIAHIGFVRQRTTSNVTAINITNVYCDCTGFFGGSNTPYAIFVTHNLPAGTYGVAGLNICDCVMANNAGDPSASNFNALIDFVKFGEYVSITGCYVANSGAAYGVEIYDASATGAQGSYIFTGNTFSNLSNDPSPTQGGVIYSRNFKQLNINGNIFRATASSNRQVLVDGTNGSLSAVGNITDGSATQMVDIAGTSTFTGNVVLLNAGQTTTNIVRLSLPTSSAGLPSGAMWDNAGVVNIVP